ncbi:MAG: L,D-transpeptidase family protein [Acidimicrobiales bacterium]|jgi:peptidoglycan hydrolase-like protein with peptidoglycan-binding domain
MGLKKRTKAFDPGGRWRVPGRITGLILIVALGAAGALIGLQRAHSNSAQAGQRPDTQKAHPTTTLPPPPLTITSVSPAPGSADAAFDTSVTVEFSQPLATDSPLPTLSPSPPGNWVRTAPAAVRFVPDGYFPPDTTVQLSVPGGPGGVRSSLGQGLSNTLRKRFVIEGGSELRLQQLLAELGYLPLEFVPAASTPVPAVPATTADTSPTRVATLPVNISEPVQPATTTTTTTPAAAIDSEPSNPALIPLQAVSGSFVWRFSNVPASLRALWAPGQATVMVTGAIMAFESDHGLAADGMAGPDVWSALLQAVAQRQVATQPYDYVIVNEGSPETATVWRDGRYIFTTLVNSGISEAPTAIGTYPVYARYVVTTMSGKNPDGTPYSDPGIPWVSYFHGGDALHGFLRASYGFPQSLGCVEMTYADAQIMWSLTPLGTLVTVI